MRRSGRDGGEGLEKVYVTKVTAINDKNIFRMLGSPRDNTPPVRCTIMFARVATKRVERETRMQCK